MIDGKAFAAAITAAAATRRGATEQQRQHLAGERRALEERLELLARSGTLDETIEMLRSERAAMETKVTEATDRCNLLRSTLEREAVELRARLAGTIQNEIGTRQSAVATADVEAARAAFSEELQRLGVSGQPSAAELAKAFHELESAAVERREHVRAAAAHASERLKQEHVSQDSEALQEVVHRRDELLSQLRHHGALSGQLPPTVRGIAESDLSIVNAFRTFTLEPLVKDLLIEAEHGLVGIDPLAKLRDDLSR